ncbi:conserved hypothetical protein [Gammaproteobacteria bacterium]
MPDTTVKVFQSTDTGAPTLSGSTGALISVLDACLVNGYGTVTLTSLTVSSNVATGTVAGGHGFSMVGNTTPQVGPVITIAGATPSALNGNWRIASIPSSTTFTFATTGISDQTATGTITASRTSAGWSKAYSGTNKAAYQSNDMTSTRMLLRVDDTGGGTGGALEARVRGYESMTDVDTGSGLFPTAAQLASGMFICKSSTLNSTARPWVVIGDGKRFFFVSYYYSASFQYGEVSFFGDLIDPRKSGDAYHCALAAKPSENTYGNLGFYGFMKIWNQNPAVAPGELYLARSYTQVGGAVSVNYFGDTLLGGTYYGNIGLTYPAPTDNGIRIAPMTVIEVGSPPIDRAGFPGIYHVLHNKPLANKDTVDNISGLSGRTIMLLATASGNVTEGRSAYDITGPW